MRGGKKITSRDKRINKRKPRVSTSVCVSPSQTKRLEEDKQKENGETETERPCAAFCIHMASVLSAAPVYLVKRSRQWIRDQEAKQ